MPHSKTPGGAAASGKAMKQEAAKTGAGTAPEAPGGNKMGAMGEAPVASDSGATKVGVEAGTSQPGEKGLKDVPVPAETKEGSGGGGSNMK